MDDGKRQERRDEKNESAEGNKIVWPSSVFGSLLDIPRRPRHKDLNVRAGLATRQDRFECFQLFGGKNLAPCTASLSPASSQASSQASKLV